MLMGFGTTYGFDAMQHLMYMVVEFMNKMTLSLTKASFGVTLLRLAWGWRQKSLIWFLIISFSLLMIANNITIWLAPCDKTGAPSKKYIGVYPGICWSFSASVNMVIAASCTSSYPSFYILHSTPPS
jgi:hypothetical protein